MVEDEYLKSEQYLPPDILLGLEILSGQIGSWFRWV
jgi:hypothetical protein